MGQQSPTSLAPGTSFVEDRFSMDMVGVPSRGGGEGMIPA